MKTFVVPGIKERGHAVTLELDLRNLLLVEERFYRVRERHGLFFRVEIDKDENGLILADTLAVCIHSKGVRIFMREPSRRSGRRSTEYDRDVMFCSENDGAIEPCEIEMAVEGHHAAPGKFRDANHVEVSCVHYAEINVPARFRPLFGIPVRAHEKSALAGDLCGDGIVVRGTGVEQKWSSGNGDAETSREQDGGLVQLGHRILRRRRLRVTASSVMSSSTTS